MWLLSELRCRAQHVELAVIEQYPQRNLYRDTLDSYLVTTYIHALPRRTLVGRPGMGSLELPRNVIVSF